MVPTGAGVTAVASTRLWAPALTLPLWWLADLAIQDDEGVNFKQAWADPASGMVFCLSEAPSAEAVQRVHERAGHPADQVYPVPVQA